MNLTIRLCKKVASEALPNPNTLSSLDNPTVQQWKVMNTSSCMSWINSGMLWITWSAWIFHFYQMEQTYNTDPFLFLKKYRLFFFPDNRPAFASYVCFVLKAVVCLFSHTLDPFPHLHLFLFSLKHSAWFSLFCTIKIEQTILIDQTTSSFTSDLQMQNTVRVIVSPTIKKLFKCIWHMGFAMQTLLFDSFHLTSHFCFQIPVLFSSLEGHMRFNNG